MVFSRRFLGGGSGAGAPFVVPGGHLVFFSRSFCVRELVTFPLVSWEWYSGAAGPTFPCSLGRAPCSRGQFFGVPKNFILLKNRSVSLSCSVPSNGVLF